MVHAAGGQRHTPRVGAIRPLEGVEHSLEETNRGGSEPELDYPSSVPR